MTKRRDAFERSLLIKKKVKKAPPERTNVEQPPSKKVRGVLHPKIG